MLYRIRQVMTIINVRLFSLATAIDPFDIITGNNQLEDATDPNTVLYLLDLQGLFYLIRKYAYIWGTIVVICLFISMQFIN